MGIRQKEKADLTRKELTEAMSALFLQKGYEETSIKDIAGRAGYSVGSFYRHWESKQQAFLELWEAYVAGYAAGTLEGAPAGGTLREMVCYFVERSSQFSSGEMTRKFYHTAKRLSMDAGLTGVDASQTYVSLLYRMLQESTRCNDERKLTSIVNIMHALLDAHAMQYTASPALRYEIDSDTLAESLYAMVTPLLA